ncbi:hypothetical protein F4808DRAFT_382136 [Astrocystis sublimbata]|nr:hypothetical protein F4808DRAFT_382136 [Astrocystis sublimbata]
MKLLTATLAALLVGIPAVYAKPTHQFDHFFPGWNNYVHDLLRENCADEYALYLTGASPDGKKQGAVNPVISCILENFSEVRKAELATGALLLGLIPMILQTIGSSTAETALIGMRRPILGFLISAGSPAVSMMKTSDFASSIVEFIEKGDTRDFHMGGLRRSQWRGPLTFLISLLEYVAVAGAVANVLHLAVNLGIFAVAIFAPDTIFGVPLWTLGATLIHIAGACAVIVRVRRRYPKDDNNRGDQLRRRINRIKRWFWRELTPAVFHPAVHMELRKGGSSTFWFYALTWCISIGILAQVAFGTVVLSGLLFFSLADCLIIVGRYALSAIVCRAVVRLELAGMTASMITADRRTDGEAVESEHVVLTTWKGQPQDMYHNDRS